MSSSTDLANLQPKSRIDELNERLTKMGLPFILTNEPENLGATMRQDVTDSQLTFLLWHQEPAYFDSITAQGMGLWLLQERVKLGFPDKFFARSRDIMGGYLHADEDQVIREGLMRLSFVVSRKLNIHWLIQEPFMHELTIPKTFLNVIE